MEAIAEIRHRCPGTKIVVFSAMSAAQAETEALAKGADAYVEKTRVVEDLTDTPPSVRRGVTRPAQRTKLR